VLYRLQDMAQQRKDAGLQRRKGCVREVWDLRCGADSASLTDLKALDCMLMVPSLDEMADMA
jgi:hypothetical protein